MNGHEFAKDIAPYKAIFPARCAGLLLRIEQAIIGRVKFDSLSWTLFIG